MKCKNCDADLSEGTIKCPFCKDILSTVDNPMFENFNFKYTITSEEQIKMIRNAANEGKSSFNSILKRNSGKKKRKKVFFFKKKKHKRNKNKGEKLSFSKLTPQHKMYICFYGGLFLILLIIAGIISGFSALINRERTINPVVYSKDNSIYLVYEKKDILLTDNAIDMNSAFSASNLDDETEISDIMKKANLIKNDESGMLTYYFENYDINSNSGSLNRIYNGRKKAPISNGVHNSFVLSPDGDGVLFLQNADKNGDMGNLCYWNSKMDEPKRIASDIDKNSFIYSENGKYILFIKNYNYATGGGDLCIITTDKEEECITLDSGVYAVYGSDLNEKNFIYSKDYNKETKTFNLYIKDQKSDAIKFFEGAVKKPILPKKGKTILTYASGDEKMNALYAINLKNFGKTKIASQATEVVKTDDKNETLIYNKVYDKYITDCYFYTKGKKPVKAADNVIPAPSKLSGTNLFSYSDDFKKAVYISGFDKNRNGGTLYLVDLTKESDNIEEITTDAYMCRISQDGKKIVYAKDYSAQRDVFDLYVYSKGNSVLLEEEVDASYFGMTKDREYYFYLENHDMTGPYGKMKVFDIKGKEIASFENVWAFDRFADSDIIFFSNYLATDETWTVQTVKGGAKKAKIIGNKIDAVISY